MRNTIFLIIMLSVSASAYSQQPTDSTDLFYRHLSLGEIVVTGTTGQTKLKHATAPITLLSTRELQQTASTNITDLLSRLPGMAQISTGTGIAKPVIRGLGYNRIVVVHDGVRQEGQQWGDEHGLEIDDKGIGNVEVLMGPASILYGSDALGGVVLLNSFTPSLDNSRYANMAAEYQTVNGLFAYSLNTGGNSRQFSWDLRYTDKMMHPYRNAADGYVLGSQMRERSLSSLLALNGQWGFSRLRFNYYHGTPSLIEGERDPLTGKLEDPYDDRHRYGHAVPYQQVKHFKATLDNRFYVGGGSLQALIAYQQNIRREYEDEDGVPECGLHFRLHTVNYDFRYTHSNSNAWNTAVGIGGMLQRSFNRGEEYLIPAYRLADVGAYFTLQKDFGRFDVNGGIRADVRWLHSYALDDDGEQRFKHFSKRMQGITASIGATYHPSRKLNLKANLARGFRAPNMSELGSNGIHEGTFRYEVGNSRLRPEYSLQADLGAEYTTRFLAVKANLFANRIDNYIYLEREAYSATPFSGSVPSAISRHISPGYDTFRFTSGDALLYGGEVHLDVHPIHSLHIGTALSYVDGRRMHAPQEQRYLPMLPPLRWTFDVKYELTHDARLFNNAYVALGIACHARQNHYLAYADTETPTPGYSLLHAAVGTDIYHHAERRATVTLSIDNMLDKVYQSHLSRLKYAPVNTVSGHRGVFNPGRNITLKVIVPVTF